MDDDAQMVAIDKDQLARMRGEYGPEKDGCGDLDFDWLDDGWLTLLRRWLNDAQRAGVSEPNAMVLATVADGKPVTRSVLCKILDESGVAFFTSYTSAKGEQLAVTPYASATFPWYQLGRQAHVQGPVSKVSTEEIFTYWSMRWNDAAMLNMVSPCWTALTRLVQNDPPSRMRSTRKTVRSLASPGRRK